MRPRAFVVMPFGEKEVEHASARGDGDAGYPVVVDFDLVYRELIRPALEDAGCEPFRADEEAAAGDIRTDMYFELVTAELVLADISILNPNVFYELGIRHGVAERGVLVLHGGWSRRPFDLAPDRTIAYDGELFRSPNPDDESWRSRIAAEVGLLAGRLRAAIGNDEQSVGSPVYKELRGLVPVDWRRIETARAKYFGTEFLDWRGRVRAAQAKGHVGDILTLARDAPNRFFAQELTLAAARALVAVERFDLARDILAELHEADRDNAEVLCELGQVLGRLGDTAEAERRLGEAAAVREGDPEAHGMLGRLHKDRWRVRWEHLDDACERRRVALEQRALAEAAIRSYDFAQRRNLDSYYNGINVVALRALLEHLGAEVQADPSATPTEDLVSVVRVAATRALEQADERAVAEEGESAERVWAQATLGELELLVGDSAVAIDHYRSASSDPSVTSFQIDSMLSQLRFYELLEFRPEAVSTIVQIVAGNRQFATGAGRKRFDKVVVASGHMIDVPDRLVPRFPPEKEPSVRKALRAVLARWSIGEGDLGICGGARGADIIFAELCLEFGASVQLQLPLPTGEFLERSVRLRGTDWEERFHALTERCETSYQHERLGRPPANMSPFARNNLWCLDCARVEASSGRLHVAVVWDEQPTGDGPGGTSHFVSEAKRLDARLSIVNPTTL